MFCAKILKNNDINEVLLKNIPKQGALCQYWAILLIMVGNGWGCIGVRGMAGGGVVGLSLGSIRGVFVMVSNEMGFGAFNPFVARGVEYAFYYFIICVISAVSVKFGIYVHFFLLAAGICQDGNSLGFGVIP